MPCEPLPPVDHTTCPADQFGDYPVLIAEDARIEAGVVFNSAAEPIVIDAGAEQDQLRKLAG